MRATGIVRRIDELGTLDIIGMGILCILVIFYFVSFFKDLHWFAKQDPLPKHPKDEHK